MKHAWVSKVGMIALVGGLCLVGYGLAHAEKPIKDRFKVLHNDPAWVLDRTTSLQWQIAPSSGTMTWTGADAHCSSLGDGSRLPEIKELISLVDYSQFFPALPPNHPFTVGTQSRYWSVTTVARTPVDAWDVNISDGEVEEHFKPDTVLELRAWCVR